MFFFNDTAHTEIYPYCPTLSLHAALPNSRALPGSRIARGNVAGRQLASRDRFATWRHRRVMVKSRIVRFDKAKGLGAARAHLRYIQRDGVTRDGERGQLYSAANDRADGKALDRKSVV